MDDLQPPSDGSGSPDYSGNARGTIAVPPIYRETPLVQTFPLEFPTTRRRWPRRPHWSTIALAAAGVAVVVLGAVAFIAHQEGEQWKRRAEQWEDRAASLNERLTESEADANALEVRVDGLANEKARAQDERNAADSQRRVYGALAGLAAEAVDDLENCRSSLARTLSATISQLGFEVVAWSTLQAMASESDSLCYTARQSYQQLADAISSL
jgi:hypothetical protein